jgi:hypothetical protein
MVLKAASPSMWPRGLCTGVSQRLVVTISLFLMFALREVHSADRAEDRLWAPNTNTCWRGQCQAEFEMVPGNRGQFGVVLRLRGGRKGVSAKHTSKEMAEKHKLATKNMGGGKEGLQDRLGGKAGHAKFVCPLPGCNMQAPSIRNMQGACACLPIQSTEAFCGYASESLYSQSFVLKLFIIRKDHPRSACQLAHGLPRLCCHVPLCNRPSRVKTPKDPLGSVDLCQCSRDSWRLDKRCLRQRDRQSERASECINVCVGIGLIGPTSSCLRAQLCVGTATTHELIHARKRLLARAFYHIPLGVAVHGTLKTDKLKAKAKKEKAETAK